MRRRKYEVLSLLVLVILFLSACQVVRGSRNLVTESREVSGFDSIVLTEYGDVILTQDGQESLTIETDDNIMQYVTSEVRDNTLYLGVQELFWIRASRLVYTISVDDVVSMAVSGSGNIIAADIETDSLEVDISGSGNVHIGDLVADEFVAGISGSGDIRINDLAAEEFVVKVSGSGSTEIAGEVLRQQIGISGSGEHDGRDLRSQVASVKISGSGNATVWAVDSLDARVRGSGSIDYYGNPKVEFNGSGSGNVKSRGDRQATR